MKHLITFFILTLSSSSTWAQTTNVPEEVSQFDIRKYNLEQVGIRDLVFEARMDNLSETLTKALSLGKLTDVHFKIYWMAPDQWKVDVNGLPKSAVQVEQDLRQLITGKLEFIVAKSLGSSLTGLSFEKVVIDGKNFVKAFDPNYTRAFNEILMEFDNSGKMIEMRTVVPGNLSINLYEYNVQSWSNNKFLVSKLVSKAKYGATESTITHSLEYQSVNGVGVPAKITIKTQNKTTIPARGKDKEKIINQELNSAIKFSKFELNTGKAKRYIVDGLLK